MSRPRFTLVVPTYQRRCLVLETLGSIGRIAYAGSWDVIVTVDGSTDGTCEALERGDWPFPLTLVVQDNRGLAAARNAGAARAKGDILLFLDDDMQVASDLLDHHAEAMGKGVVASAGRIGLAPDADTGFLNAGVARWTGNALAGSDKNILFAFYGGHCAVRRDAFEQVGGFDEAYTAHGGYGREDTDLALRLMSHGSLARCPEARTWQKNTVDAAQALRRSIRQGEADVRFARKHPGHAGQLLAAIGGRRPLDQFTLKPLAALPYADRLSAWLARLVLRRNLPGQARLFDLARRIGWWTGAGKAGGYPQSRRVLALCYHAIADHRDDPVLAPYSISPDMFADHIGSLARRGFSFVDGDTARAVASGDAVVPERAVLLTFDDGYEDLVKVARDLLGPQRIPALAFLVSGRLGDTNRWDQPAGAKARQLVDAQGAAALVGHGLTLGSHSQTHADLKGLEPAELQREIAAPLEDFPAAGLPAPRHFAYPFGEKDAAAKAQVRAAGYRAGWGLADRRIVRGSDPFDLPRVMMHSTDKPWRFRFKTRFPTAATVLRHWPFVKRR